MPFEELISKMRATVPTPHIALWLDTAIQFIISDLPDFDSEERSSVLLSLMSLAIRGVSLTETNSEDKVQRIMAIQERFDKYLAQLSLERN